MLVTSSALEGNQLKLENGICIIANTTGFLSLTENCNSFYPPKCSDFQCYYLTKDKNLFCLFFI